MKNALFKDIFREIRKRKIQFLTLTAILVLGVSFFVGIRVTGSDMRDTGDAYYRTGSLSDFFLLSTMGFDEESVVFLREKLGDSARVEGSRFSDTIAVTRQEYEVILRVYSLPDSVADVQSMQNVPILKEGRLPENRSEGLLDSGMVEYWGMKLGDTLILQDEEAFTETRITVVGSVMTPLYLNMSRGSGRLGDGQLDGFLYVPEGNFTADIFARVCIVFEEGESLYAFGDEYRNLIAEKQSLLKGLEAELAVLRLASVKEPLLQELEVPRIFVQTRDEAALGYAEFSQDSERIEAIGQAFPVIFFLVAALVCLNTMARMVEEHRTQSGILKALGYGNGRILLKYLLFAGMACVAGILIGGWIGFYFLPAVIFNAYRIYYNTPELIAGIKLSFIGLPALGAVLSTVGVAVVVSRIVSRTMPASLLRPSSPKAGKRISLERIRPFWSRLTFLHKITARNLLRNKSRFWMSVLGIGACMGLMVTGFGLDTAINTIAGMQFEEVLNFQMQLAVELSDDENRDSLFAILEENDAIQRHAEVWSQNVNASADSGGAAYSASVYVPQDVSVFPDFVALRERVGGKQLSLADEGAVIDEKLGLLLNLSVGDMIRVTDEEKGLYAEIPVLGLTENYVAHYIYLTPGAYERFVEPAHEPNLLFLQVEGGESTELALARSFLEEKAVVSIFRTAGVVESLSDTMDSFSFVVAVVIAAACLLAFVVMMNLTSMNINERIRELSTLKVLGFFDRETGAYIFRENLILTLLGILGGWVFGIYLNQYVVRTVEIDIVMFNRQLYWYSVVYAVLLTVAFSVVVNLIMFRKIKRVDMLDALKSVE